MRLAPVISYTGNKYRHIDMILSHIPDEVNTFYDVFGGSGVVATNVAAYSDCNNVVYNEVNTEIHNLLFHALTTESFQRNVTEIDELYSDDKKGYLALRELYNELNGRSIRSYAILYVLHCRSFNNQFRWNKAGKWNLPYGDRNNLMQRIDALNSVKTALKNKVVGWLGLDYLKLVERFSGAQDSFFFFDPPYINSDATYSSGWNEENEIQLYKTLNSLTEEGVRWMLTNTTYNRGKPNPFLIDFLDEDDCGNSYHIEELSCNHGNSSYHKSDKKTVEVLVTNY